jgi:hypothetical protein
VLVQVEKMLLCFLILIGIAIHVSSIVVPNQGEIKKNIWK